MEEKTTKAGAVERGARGKARARWAVRAAIAAGVLCLAAAGARAETVAVADCERDSAVDVWAAPDVEFCRRVMDEVFAMAGVEPARAEFDADGMLVVSNAEVVCSAFRTPKLLEDYDFPIQPMGRMHYGLYVAKKQASRLFGAGMPEGARPKVAYSPVSQGQRDNEDRVRYFERAGLDPEYVEYPTSEGAVEALKAGEVDALFLYTPYGKRPVGLREIVPIGMRNIYFAVRKDRPELLERLSAAYREWYIDHIDRYDEWREELLGIPKPGNRVRIAAFERGELFRVSPDGKRSGRLEEWIRALCEVAHWTPDYVYGSFGQCLEDVRSGRLDLMGGVTASPERRADFLMPHTACGVMRVYLWTHRNSRYRAGKPETWGGMKLGLLAGTHSRLRVKEQVAQGGLDIEVAEFALEREMLEAYAAGEIDACVNVEMRELAEDRALRLYEALQMYFACPKSRPELFGELERAIDSICDDHPRYMRLISERHYGARGGMGELSAAETEWLAKRLKNPLPIVVDFSPWPFPMKDDKGKPVGFPPALLKELSRRTGLPFVAAVQTGARTAEAKFLRGETPFWVPYPAAADEYEAVRVFSFPVPGHCAEGYGAEDPQAEFALLAQPGTPDALVSILRKGFEGISDEKIQEMMVEALAERHAERKVFGLSDEELKEFGALAGLALFLLVTLYGAGMMAMLRRNAQRAENAAIRAEESAQSKTRFLAMMSHELRTPLNAVIGFAEFLARGNLPKPKQEEFLQGIITSSTALLDLVNDVLDLSKLETGSMRMRAGGCPVGPLMEELPSIFAAQTEANGVKLTVRRTGDYEVPDMVLSRQGLRQVMLNLVGNAAKFTKNGTISVEYGWEPEQPGTGTLRVVVKDTGCGISKEKLERVFDPFVQDIASRMQNAAAQTKGTGLGLPIVKRLVDAAGGTISVKSEVGKGTEFTVVLPSLCVAGHAEEQKEGDTPAAAAADAAPAGEKVKVPGAVLVVDDVAVNRKVLGIHLRNIGVKDVRYAENGVGAMAEMKEWTPDLVLTDMWMPAMDGGQLAEAMAAVGRLAKVPLVVITADVDIEATHSVQRFAKILQKPVTGGKLRALFREMGGKGLRAIPSPEP
jgi:signal transduction histidine kinase